MKTIAVYFRVSTDKQDTESQINTLNTWLASLPESPTVIYYTDKGRSGADSQRPEFQRMLRDARDNKFDTIVAYSLDRLSRKSTEALRLILELDDLGVVFHSLSQPVLNLGPDMPFRKMILAMFAEIAQMERETTIGRVKAGIAAARAQGKVIGQPTKLTRAMHQDLLRLRREGMGVRGLAEHFGVGHSLIQRAIKHDVDDQIQYAV